MFIYLFSASRPLPLPQHVAENMDFLDLTLSVVRGAGNNPFVYITRSEPWMLALLMLALVQAVKLSGFSFDFMMEDYLQIRLNR